MEEYLFSYPTWTGVYHMSLMPLADQIAIPCPEWNTTQKEISVTLCALEPLREPRISRLFFGGPGSLEQYRQEMLDGILDFEVERGNWNYTYHSRYEDQYEFIIDELRRDPWSRRAVMDIRTPEDIGSKDPACWQHAQYFIRDGKLHCKTLFRSNDACKAAFMNGFALICLQEKIANALHVPVGSYTHRANSYHCYERDFDMLDSYVRRINLAAWPDDDSLTYRYCGGWDGIMNGCKDSIAAMVDAQKNKKEECV